MIALKGRLDLYSSIQLKDLAMKMFSRKISRLIINMEQVDSIDSSGIGALIHICSAVKKMNVALAIANMQDAVKSSIDLTKVTGYFPIANSIEGALSIVSR